MFPLEKLAVFSVPARWTCIESLRSPVIFVKSFKQKHGSCNSMASVPDGNDENSFWRNALLYTVSHGRLSPSHSRVQNASFYTRIYQNKIMYFRIFQKWAGITVLPTSLRVQNFSGDHFTRYIYSGHRNLSLHADSQFYGRLTGWNALIFHLSDLVFLDSTYRQLPEPWSLSDT